MSRALRRFHAERLRKRWIKIVKVWRGRPWLGIPIAEIDPAVLKEACVHVNTRKTCSCFMCCTKRKIYGKTKQERFSDMDFETQLREIEQESVVPDTSTLNFTKTSC